MALTPATTDKFTKVGSPGSATTLAAPGYTIGNASINVGSTTNWQTETLQVFAIDRAQVVNGAEARIAGTYNEFVGIVSSATSVGSLTKRYGTAQDYAAGSLTRVYIPVSSTRENDIVDGLAQDHNLKGNHKTLTDTNGNEMLEFGVTASAVNQLKATNAATTAAPKLSASGDDTNIGLDVQPKGSGILQLLDGNGNEVIKTAAAVASAVNELTAQNAATTNAPQLQATGGDTNIDLRLVPKGTGNVKRGATGGAIDWWEELGRTTLAVAGDTMSIATIPARKYLRILIFVVDTGGTIQTILRFNNDSGANYSRRDSSNGGADGSGANVTEALIPNVAANPQFMIWEVINVLAQEKLIWGQAITRTLAGAGSIPGRHEIGNKWANTTAQITRVDAINIGAGDFAIGSEIVVLGHD